MKFGPKTTEALAAIAAADSVELGPVGVAGALTPAFLAYQALSTDAAALAAAGPLLQRMQTAPSPAARFYAALLLRQLDPEAGRAALQALTTSTEDLSVATGGCMPLPVSTLGEAAALFLGPGPLSS